MLTVLSHKSKISDAIYADFWYLLARKNAHVFAAFVREKAERAHVLLSFLRQDGQNFEQNVLEIVISLRVFFLRESGKNPAYLAKL